MVLGGCRLLSWGRWFAASLFCWPRHDFMLCRFLHCFLSWEESQNLWVTFCISVLPQCRTTVYPFFSLPSLWITITADSRDWVTFSNDSQNLWSRESGKGVIELSISITNWDFTHKEICPELYCFFVHRFEAGYSRKDDHFTCTSNYFPSFWWLKSAVIKEIRQ
jgi:hypothetical protein